MRNKDTSFINQLKNLQYGQQFLAILILLFVLALAWIFVGIFAGQQTSAISPAQKKAAAALTPQLDVTVLEEIESKRVYSDDELSTFPIYKVIPIDRGRQQAIVPITYQEETEDNQPSGSGGLNSLIETDEEPEASESAANEGTSNQEVPVIEEPESENTPTVTIE